MGRTQTAESRSKAQGSSWSHPTAFWGCSISAGSTGGRWALGPWCQWGGWGSTDWSGSRGSCWFPVPMWALCHGHGAVPSPRTWNNPQPGANIPSTKPQKPRGKDKPLSQYVTGPGPVLPVLQSTGDREPQMLHPLLSCHWGCQERALLQPEEFGDSRRAKELCPWDGNDTGHYQSWCSGGTGMCWLMGGTGGQQKSHSPCHKHTQLGSFPSFWAWLFAPACA